MKKIRLLIVLTFLGLLFPTKLVFADTIYACKIADPGFPGGLYFVGTTVPTCQPGDEVISWNQMGSIQKQFVFKGFSSTKATGQEGIGRFNQLCAEEVSSTSRLCNTKEVFESVNPFPAPLAEPIWIHPTIVTTTSGSDYSGVTEVNGITIQQKTCSGWSSLGGTGLVFQLQGNVDKLPCDIARPVACCGPAQ